MTNTPLAIAVFIITTFTVTVLVGAMMPIWIDPLAGVFRRPINRLRVRPSRDPVYRLRPGQLVQTTLRMATRDTGKVVDPQVLFLRTGHKWWMPPGCLDPVDHLTPP